MANIALTGAILMLQDGPRRLTLRISGDRFATIGGSPQPDDRIVDMSGHIIFPGLINAYDRLDLNIFPRIKLRGSYANARDWHEEIIQHLYENDGTASLMELSLHDRLFLGAIKNVLAGTTTVLHHGNFHRSFKKNSFPVNVIDKFGWHPSLYEERNLVRSFDRTPHTFPWLIRLSEGTDEDALKECYMLDEVGCLDSNTVVIHGVGLNEVDINRMKEVGAGLIWCPESNRYLLGKTSFHSALLGRMALGTASRLTGSLDMLEELKVAAQLSDLTGHRLVQLALRDAAKLLRIPKHGILAHDSPADVLILKHTGHDPYETLLNAHRVDLRMVMVGGQPQITAPELESIFALTRTSFQQIRLDGVKRLLSRDLYNRLDRIGVLEAGLELL